MLQYSVLCTVESLSLLYLLFISWFVCSGEMVRGWVGGHTCKPKIYVLVHILIVGEVGTMGLVLVLQ